jgi:hypothetical protein
MEVWGTKGDGEIAIEYPDMRRCVRRLKLPGSTLNDRSEDDLIPMRLEQFPQQALERRLVGRQRENLDDMPVIVGDACWNNRGI